MNGKKLILKVLKITGISLTALVLIIFLLPELFPGFVARKIKSWANQNIEGELNFSGARLSFIKHFPSLTLSLNNFSLLGSQPFKNDTLIAGKEIAFGLDLSSVFKSQIKVDQFFITNALINIQVDSAGHANYNIYKSTDTSAAPPSDSSEVALKIDKISIAKSKLVYHDRSLPMEIVGEGLNYIGTGDLSKEVFDLTSNLKIDSLNFLYDGEVYVEKKKLNAQLITKINTSSLALVFEKNDLLINKLPVGFKGRFDFLKNGYEIDLRFNSGHTNLHDIFTVLPPQYLNWLAETDMNGDAVIKASFIGQYIAETNSKPTLEFGMQVYGGSINHAKAPVPVTNLLVKFNTVVPELNPDSLVIKLDTLSFNLDKDYLHAAFYSQGVDRIEMHSHADSEIDLEKLARATGLKGLELKGKSQLHFKADGVFSTGINPNKLRPDTIITSIPKFTLESTLDNGYFKYTSLPEPLTDISFSLRLACPNNNYKNIGLTIDKINAAFLKNYIKGFINIKNLQDAPIKANFSMAVNLADLKKVIPLKDMEMEGDLSANLIVDGNYLPAKKQFPNTNATIQLKNGLLKTAYYPSAISNIETDIKITDNASTLAGLVVSVQPFSFSFEGQPFAIHASLSNFDNMRYNVRSKGTLDIGKIYQVFSQKGIGVKGWIQTDFALDGTQADATAGRYDKLRNVGSLRMKDIEISYDEYPKPFLIQHGLLQFKQDKVWLNNMLVRYGTNNLLLKGYVENTIDYMVKNKPLKGVFLMSANKISLDEFASFAGSEQSIVQPATSAETGVVIVPDNLSVLLKASAKTVTYNGLDLKDLKGNVLIDSGRIVLDSTAFRLADALVNIKAGYGSLSPKKAQFNFEIKADSFDVKKAYKEVKLFRDMASSAAKAEGIVSLDYNLEGKLDGNMMPIYPSLKGGGVLSLAQVKVYGLKLFSAVSKATGRDSISNPNLKKVDIKTTIANNIITIERTKMKVFGFRPRIEGQTSFDGKLNLAFRLGLPPFGIFGIPMTVTGTSANPIVKLKRAKEEDKLEETEESSEDD
jgi:AsmA protein